MRPHGQLVVEHAAIAVADVGEAVDEEHDVGVAFGVPLVDHEPLPASRRPPVDRAHAVSGYEVAEVGVLDPVTLRPGDLAPPRTPACASVEEGGGARLGRGYAFSRCPERTRPSHVTRRDASRARIRSPPIS